MMKKLLHFIGIVLMAGVAASATGQSSTYIPTKWVANKGLSVESKGHFPGCFRIKLREDKYISIEGKRYFIDLKESEIKFSSGNHYQVMYATTYYPPSYSSQKPGTWYIGISALPDEGGSLEYHLTIYDSNKKYFCTYRGGPYKLQSGQEGTSCTNCWDDIYDSL